MKRLGHFTVIPTKAITSPKNMLKKYQFYLIICVLLLISFIPVFSRYQDLQQRTRELSRKIQVLQEENAVLKERQHRMQTDPIYAESVARQKFSIVKEDEVVYKIIEE